MSQSSLKPVLKFAGMGWKLFPQDRNKRPCIKDWPNQASSDPEQIMSWAWTFPKANFAVVTGQCSGIIVLDVDVKNGQQGKTSFKKLQEEFGKLNGLIVRTGSGGLHIYLKYPANNGEIRNRAILAGYPGIELKAEGGCATLPGSIYSDGREYVLVSGGKPENAPERLIEFLTSNCQASKETVSSQAGKIVAEGERNSYLTKMAGVLRARGEGKDSLIHALQALNLTRCLPPLLEGEVKRIAESVSKYQTPDPLLLERWTEGGLADRMAKQLGEQMRYCYLWKSWLVWSEGRWLRDELRLCLRYARDLITKLYTSALGISDTDLRGGMMKNIGKMETSAKLKAALELLSADARIAAHPEQFDQNPFLLNVSNGTIELSEQGTQLREHQRQDNITKLAPVEYAPEATCPRWIRFLDEVTAGDTHLQVFLQQIVGYALTGDTRGQVMFILYGTGCNGKSTFIETIASFLGDYAEATPIDTLLVKRDTDIPNDLARLKGARFVYTGEPELGRRLSEGRIKQMTGQDTITARFLHAEFFDFKPQFKLFLSTNHRPNVRGQDHAIWRRILTIPFDVRIPEDRIDPDLAEKLKAEMSGLLNWALEGCVDWLRNGLSLPQSVSRATQEYRDVMDVLHDFLENRCEINVPDSVGSSEFYNAYRTWCEDSGDKAVSQTKFSLMLEERDFQKEKTKTTRNWVGIRLKKG